MKGLDWKSKVKLNGKNLLGWKTKRKIVVFAVDDYGNVRIDSPEARTNLDKAGLQVQNRFDAYDSLETREDLEMLFQVLSSVRDKNDRHAVFTSYAVPCNIDFEKLSDEGYQNYYYETLPQTFQKKSDLDPQSYNGAWELWKSGLREGLFIPQFHGREHFNIKLFKEQLACQDKELSVQLKNRTLTHLSSSKYTTISGLASFDFWNFDENKQFRDIISDGLNQFESVFGFRAHNFTPPSYKAHPVLYHTLKKNGIHFIDGSFIANQHQGKGYYKKEINYTGKKKNGLHKIVRNVVFEPTSNLSIDWISYTIKQIEAAFRWNRPAIISSHRVNFCGHIDSDNRKTGICALENLLHKIVNRWPDVEFMSADELGTLMKN